MVDPIYFNNAQSAASMQKANYLQEQTKTSSFEQALNAASESGDDEAVMEAAREFESYFLQVMLKSMRNTVPQGELIPKSNAEQIFQDMLDEEYSKNAAKGSGIGLAQMIFEQMTRNSVMPAIAAEHAASESVPGDAGAESEAESGDSPGGVSAAEGVSEE